LAFSLTALLSICIASLLKSSRVVSAYPHVNSMTPSKKHHAADTRTTKNYLVSGTDR
jgi:hypothetical protein